MEVGMIGLGRMGLNMAIRLVRGDHKVFGWNRSEEPRRNLAGEGGKAVATVEELVRDLKVPKVVWIMLPAGQLVDDMIDKLLGMLKPGDVIIEGGNSRYTDSIRFTFGFGSIVDRTLGRWLLDATFAERHALLTRALGGS